MSPDQTPEDSSRSRLEVPLVGHAASHWLGAVQFALLPMMPAPTARNQPNSVRLEPLGTQAGYLACYALFIQSESSQPTSSPIAINPHATKTNTMTAARVNRSLRVPDVHRCFMSPYASNPHRTNMMRKISIIISSRSLTRTMPPATDATCPTYVGSNGGTILSHRSHGIQEIAELHEVADL